MFQEMEFLVGSQDFARCLFYVISSRCLQYPETWGSQDLGLKTNITIIRSSKPWPSKIVISKNPYPPCIFLAYLPTFSWWIFMGFHGQGNMQSSRPIRCDLEYQVEVASPRVRSRRAGVSWWCNWRCVRFTGPVFGWETFNWKWGGRVYTIVKQVTWRSPLPSLVFFFRKGPWCSSRLYGSGYPSILSRWCSMLLDFLGVIQSDSKDWLLPRSSWWFVTATSWSANSPITVALEGS